jgi:predicted CopG family antitoxin
MTRETLKSLKRGGETYDAVIKRLIEKEDKSR